jgi:hypothetical protein
MSQEIVVAHGSGKVRAAIGRASDFFGRACSRWPRASRSSPTPTRPTSARGWSSWANARRLWVGRGTYPILRHSPHASSWRIFEEVGKPARIQAAPKIVLRALGLFNPPLRETIEMLYKFEEPFVVAHSDFTRTFGDHATSLGTAIRETVQWYRERRSRAR